MKPIHTHKSLIFVFLAGVISSIISAEDMIQNERAPRPLPDFVKPPVGPGVHQVNSTGNASPISSPVEGAVQGPAVSTLNAVARFGDTSGTLLKNSSVLVDDAGNIQIEGITKNGNTVSWPSIIGAAGTFLASDGTGNLVYGTPAGGGNVSTALPFTTNNALVTTDLPSGVENVKQSMVTLDASNNLSGLNTVNATTINAPTLTGAALLNVLKSGDTMTGNLNLATQSELRFQDAAGGEYVGLRAPTTIPTSYTLNLPTTAPLSGQFLQAISPSSLQWTTVGGNPTLSKQYYVSLDGNDSNDGSLSTPFRTVSHALTVANANATSNNPVVINIGPGIFVENNTGGPLNITANSISLVGNSVTGTLLIPMSAANDFFNITVPSVEFDSFSIFLASPGSTGNAITLNTTAGGLARFQSITIFGAFHNGFLVNAVTGSPAIIFDNIVCAGCSTGISVSNFQCMIKSSVIQGSFSTTAAHTGIQVSGNRSQIYILSTLLRYCALCLVATDGAITRVLATDLDNSTQGVQCLGGSNTSLIGCNFLFNSVLDLEISEPNTLVTVEGCHFNCASPLGVPQGTAIQVTNGASAVVESCGIVKASLGISCGTPSDTSSTKLNVSGTVLDECVADIVQQGSSTLHFVSGTFDSHNVSVADSTNVNFAAFDSQADEALTLGNGADVVQDIYQIFNGEAPFPLVVYQPNYYGAKGTVYVHQDGQPTFNATQALTHDANYFVVTQDRTQQATLGLLSDSGNVGVGDNVRGWGISKLGTSGDLAFTYTNNDISGQAARGSNTVMQLNGFDNIVEFPLATNTPLPTNSVAQLQWAGDTNLYRSAANTLKTDGNLAIGSLTPAGVVHNDVNGLLSSSFIVNADISSSAAITDNKLATISTGGKVANSATTATTANTPNTIVLRDGSGNFAAGTITANLTGNVTGNATTATIATNFSGSLAGDVTGTQGATVVSTVGGQTAANVASATTAANASTSTNTPNTLVKRDGSGNFVAGTITANLTGNVTGNLSGNATTATSATTATNFSGPLVGDVTGTQGATVVSFVGGQTASNVAAATVLANNATSSNTASAIVRRDGSGNFSAGTITANLSGNATTATTATSATTATNFSGALAGDVTGPQGATVVSTVGGQSAANVASATTAANAATDLNTANTIVKRDASGNFVAGTITANLTGNVTGNLSGNATSATTATTATNFSGTLSGDVTGTQGATVVNTVGGQTATNVASATTAANAATSTNTPNTIVKRDGSGNFVAGTITANLTGNVTGNVSGNATTASSATTATNFTGPLTGDVTGTQGATVVSSVGGQTAANVASAAVLANAATSADTASAIVRRDGSGNFSAGTITASLTGNVTGNLAGNAATATSATTAGSATNFTGLLAGDVTGNQGATVVGFVGGQAAAAVAAATALVGTATSNDVANTLVLRDASGNFATNRITLDGTVTNPTDAATKAYVDSVAGLGLEPQTPAVVVATSNVTLSGLPTIDGIALNPNDRVLLVGQTNPVENGLWLAQAGAWTRPTDFASGTSAGQAYVLITSGTVNSGSSWICNTPTAIIDTDPLSFVEFSLPSQTTGANVGTGVGQIFRDKTGITLNFKTIAAGSHIQVTNNPNEVIIASDGTSVNTPNTVVARDGSGNFAAGTITANLTGAASANVLKAGDTMSGNLNMATQSEVRFQDAGGGEYIGLRAPATVAASYTVDLPANGPIPGQFLQAVSASSLQWSAVGGTPAVEKTYYVTLGGSDSNDGSLSAPFRTVSHAVSVANTVASSSNPVAISIGAGVFVENNSGGPIAITASGISIIGTSITSTIIVPTTPSNDLFSSTTANLFFIDLTLDAGGFSSTASAVNTVAGTGQGGFQTVIVSRFQTGFSLNGSVTVPQQIVANCVFLGNGTAISVNNARVIGESSVFLGNLLSNTPANTAISITGTNALVTLMGDSLRLCATGLTVAGGANVRLLGTNIETATNSLVANGGCNVAVVGCNFIFNNANSINVTASGTNTKVTLDGCQFQCNDVSNTPQGTAIQLNTGATMFVDSCAIERAGLGIQCGLPGDTSDTFLQASGIVLVECVQDIVQQGASALQFVAGTFEESKISIGNSLNVSFAAFNTQNSNSTALLAIGDTVDESQPLLQILNGQPNLPVLQYEPNYYGAKGTVYVNLNADPTFYAVQAASNDARYYAVTEDRTKEANINLISDTSNVGNGDNVRGWGISKLGTSADLAFTYSNSDTSGQAARGSNTVMQLNGFDNIVEFPVATNTPLPTNSVAQLLWAGDTNLYRSAAGTLKTDGNLAVGGLTPAGIVHNDATGLLSSSLIVNADISGLAAITDNKLATISTPGKVANSATTATSSNTPSTIVLRDGSGNFAAGTITANVTGAASANVLKAGDTMTGNLNMAAQSEVRFQDAAGGEYVGLRAPSSVGTPYTVDLPSGAPTAGQVLQAVSPSVLQWATVGGSPTVAKTYYVALDGSDSNDGSFSAPFRTVSHAVTVANSVASAANPLVISIGAGIFVEDNSGGPLTITADGISLVGASLSSTIISPSTLSVDLFSCTTPNVEFLDCTLDAGGVGSTANGLTLTTNTPGVGRFTNMVVHSFATGLSLNSAAGVPIILLSNIQPRNNGVGIAANNIRALLENCVFLGPQSGTTPANMGLSITGSTALVTLLSSSFRLLVTAISVNGGAQVRILGTNIESTTNGLMCTGASNTQCIGCNFVFNNASSVNISASGANTTVTIDGSHFQCNDASGTPRGTALQVTGGASIIADSSTILNAAVAIVCGTSSDTSTTEVRANGVVLKGCITDVIQQGSSTLRFVAGVFDSTLVSLANTTNITFAAFDRTSDESLTIGKGVDVTQELYQVFNGQAQLPDLTYQSNYYGAKGTVYADSNGDATFNATQATTNDANYFVVTQDRTKQATLGLFSDTGNVGVGDNVRGWGISKVGTSADLAFTYTNNDISGQAARGSNTVMQLNGFDNIVEFPLATNTPLPTNSVAQLQWAGDTNLYRSAANTLKTDGNLAIGSLTPAGVVHNDVNGLLSSSLIVNADISSSAAITDTKLATISTGGKVANSATTATTANTPNTIVLRDGSGNFAAGTITANLTGNVTGNASTATTATNFSGSLAGDVTGTQSATVVSTVGGQSAANVASATTAANAASSTNTPNTIVKRDGSGNFVAGTITANLTGNVTGNVSGNATTATSATTATNFTGPLVGDVTGTQGATVVSFVGGQTAANVASATSLANAATSNNTASTIVRRDAAGNFSAGTITANLSGNATTATSFSGSLAGDVTGPQSATVVSFVGGQTAASVASATTLVGTATSNNIANTIVKRDASGNFSAGTITANLTGNVTGNATTATTSTNFSGSLAGDVTGTQGATVVSTVGGQTAANVASATTAANAATSANTANTIVKRDASGNFSAGTITASLSGNATTATTSTNFSGSLAGDVTGTQSATVVSTVGGQTAANVASAAVAANAATNADTANTIVKRDASGNFSAGTITANLNGNATTATSATTATNFTGSLNGDVTGTQSATVVSTVGGQTAANIAAGAVAANAATSNNIANTIVKRDASGNFSAGAITASLTGAASLNVLKAGDTMTGSLTLPAGTTAAPSLQFSGSTNTGVTAAAANVLSLVTAGLERLKIDASGNTTYKSNYKANAYRSTNQSVNATTATIVFDTATLDPNSNFNTATGAYTVPVTGVYFINVGVVTQTSGQPSTESLAIVRNGTAITGSSVSQIVTSNAAHAPMSTSTLVSLTAGDVIRVDYTTNKSDTILANDTHIAIHFMSF